MRVRTLGGMDLQVGIDEAAAFLSVPPEIVASLLASGDLPYVQTAERANIRLSDLTEYQRRLAERRKDALEEMAEIARESGLYEHTARSGEGIR